MNKYPPIWTRFGTEPRVIIGETKRSWLIKPDADWQEPIKLPKKHINRGCGRPQWFWDKAERDAEVWADGNFNAIKRALGEYSRGVDAATLRKIADLIGYKDK